MKASEIRFISFCASVATKDTPDINELDHIAKKICFPNVTTAFSANQ